MESEGGREGGRDGQAEAEGEGLGWDVGLGEGDGWWMVRGIEILLLYFVGNVI